MWSSQSEFRDNALSFQRELLQRCAVAKSRNEIISLVKGSPVLRNRREGPIVGIDWSIITAELRLDPRKGGGLMQTLGSNEPISIRERNSTPIEAIRKTSDYYVSYHGYCRHKCVDMTRLTEAGVVAWSEWAVKNGVRYSGDFGYIKPGAKTAAKYGKIDFAVAKAHGIVPSGKRSPEAAVRRAARRRASMNSVLRKAQRAVPSFVEVPLVVVPSMSSSELRKSWSPKSSGMRWSEYRSTVVVDNITIVGIQKGRRVPAPPIVQEAVKRIYANPVRVYAPKGMFIPDRPVKFKWRVVEPVNGPTVPYRNENLHRADRKARITEQDGIRYISYLGGQTTRLFTDGERSENSH